MSVASELHTSLRSMGFVQLLLAIVFLACYSVACSPLFETRGRLRAGGVALLSAIGFIALTPQWEHGVLMVAGAVGGLGIFSAIGWVLSTLLKLPTPKSLADPSPAAADAVAEPASAATTPRTPTVTRIPAA